MADPIFLPWVKLQEYCKFGIMFIVLGVQITLHLGNVHHCCIIAWASGRPLWSWHSKMCVGTFNYIQEPCFYLPWMGFVQMSYFVVYFIVLCHERHTIHHGMSIRRKMAKLLLDICSFHSANLVTKVHLPPYRKNILHIAWQQCNHHTVYIDVSDLAELIDLIVVINS